MAGEAIARGWPQLLGGDAVRDLPADLQTILDALAVSVPYTGSENMTSDANGYTTVNHGLPFTPSRLFIMNRTNSSSGRVAAQVDSAGPVTFRVRWLIFTTTAVPSYMATVAVNFDWMAFR